MAFAVVAPGGARDTVVIPTPAYPVYEGGARFAGAKPQGKYRPGPPPTNANVAVERGGNENRGSEVVKNKNGNENVGIPDSACRRRCRADYRRCLRGGKSRRSCEWRLRNCYRHCPQ